MLKAKTNLWLSGLDQQDRSDFSMFIVDRLEEDWAVIEYWGKTFNFPRSLLPLDVKESDVITISISLEDEFQ